MTSSWRRTITLRGRLVTLRPMVGGDAVALWDAGSDPDIWSASPRNMLVPSDMEAYVREALEEQERGVSQPFVITLTDGGEVIGSTRYGNMSPSNRRLEIGWTWLTKAWQRTAANTEAKLLLLAHAFEVLDCNRVEFKTDALNTRSRNAILRIGAIEEGTLRQHVLTEGERYRDTVYYSILRSEWSAVKRKLEERLGDGSARSR